MKMKNRLRPLLAVAAVAIGLVATSTATASISLVNRGFETGTLAGWSGGGAGVTTNYGAYSAPSGSYFAVVWGGCYTNAIVQSFTATAGETLSGWAFFKAEDYWPYNDSGSVQMTLTSGPYVLTTLFSSSVGAVGNYGGTPWTPWSYTFASAGTYELRINSSNGGDCGLSSVVGIDMVEDQPPVLTLPADITAEATNASGAAVSYTATATDDNDPSPVVACSPASGSMFAIGTTTVNCTATDAGGLSSSGSFTVTVEDTTGAALACVDGPNPSGKNVPNHNAGFRTITATDAVGVVSLQIVDSAGPFTSSNLTSGWNLKLTQSDAASEKDMAGVVSKHITTTGDPILRAVDAAGNVTTVSCA